jgi:hypothetical protein
VSTFLEFTVVVLHLNKVYRPQAGSASYQQKDSEHFLGHDVPMNFNIQALHWIHIKVENLKLCITSSVDLKKNLV